MTLTFSLSDLDLEIHQKKFNALPMVPAKTVLNMKKFRSLVKEFARTNPHTQTPFAY